MAEEVSGGPVAAGDISANAAAGAALRQHIVAVHADLGAEEVECRARADALARRIELLGTILKVPDVRLGQLLADMGWRDAV